MTIKVIGAALLATFLTTSAFADTAKSSQVANSWSVTPFGEARVFVEGSTANNVDPEVKSTDTKGGLKLNGKVGRVDVFGELSADVNINGASDTIETRFGYVGVGLQQFGSISIGKQMSLQEEFVDKADFFYNGGNAGVQKMGFYQSNSVVYKNSIGGVKVGALVAMTDSDAGNDTFDRYQVGAEFMGIGVAYGKDNGTDDVFYGVGFNRKYGPLQVVGSLSAKDPNAGDRVVGYELGVGYDVLTDVTIKAGFSDTDATNDDGVVTVGGEYRIGQQATLFTTVDYDRDSTEYTGKAGISLKF